jgi:hypothetical protein
LRLAPRLCAKADKRQAVHSGEFWPEHAQTIAEDSWTFIPGTCAEPTGTPAYLQSMIADQKQNLCIASEPFYELLFEKNAT